MVVGHCSHLETSFRFRSRRPCASARDRLTFFVWHGFWNTPCFLCLEGHCSPRDHFCGRTPLLVLNSLFSGHPAARFAPPNPRFASVLVHFWHEPCFHCLKGGTRLGDHLFSWRPLLSPPAGFLVGKLVSLIFEPHLLVSHHTTSLHSVGRPSNGLADHFSFRETTHPSRPTRGSGRPTTLTGRPAPSSFVSMSYCQLCQLEGTDCILHTRLWMIFGLGF